jgi:hypothetical protein
MEELKNLNNVTQVRELTYEVSDILSGIIFKERKIDKKLLFDDVYKYRNGKIEEKERNYMKIERKVISRYNDANYVIEEIQFDKYNCKIETVWYKYNYRNEIISTETTSIGNYVKWRYEKTQIKEDNVIAERTDVFYKDVFNGYNKTYRNSKNLSSKYESYDKNGNLEYRESYQYNSLNQLYKKTIYRSGSAPKEILFQRNSYGDIIETIESEDFKKTIRKREYKYDRHNNWIEQKVIENEKITFIYERTIHYN